MNVKTKPDLRRTYPNQHCGGEEQPQLRDSGRESPFQKDPKEEDWW